MDAWDLGDILQDLILGHKFSNNCHFQDTVQKRIPRLGHFDAIITAANVVFKIENKSILPDYDIP